MTRRCLICAKLNPCAEHSEADQQAELARNDREIQRLRGSLDYRTSWPRPATPCGLVPLWKGEFKDFGDWVSFATTRLTGTTDDMGREIPVICVDALGRRCTIGRDFMRARDEGTFPVRYFWECAPPEAPKCDKCDGGGVYIGKDVATGQSVVIACQDCNETGRAQ